MAKLKTAAELAMSRKGSKTAFGYNAVVSTDRRRPLQTRPTNEGFILTTKRREAATATARDDRRNMTILAWMVRRHLDSVSRFTPHFRFSGEASTEKEQLNTIVKKLLAWHAHKRQFDATRRHGRNEWMRMFEATKVIGGDCGGLKIAGGHLQGIEGERIAKRATTTLSDKVLKSFSDSGIQFAADGTRKAFMLCKRTATGNELEFERIVPEADMVFDGYWPERYDADRGVSPLLTALNEAADTRETWEWHLLKVKAAGIFGFAFTRNGRESLLSTQDNKTEQTDYAPQVGASVKARGLINLDLDPGDDVKSIESTSPNPNVIPFTRELIRSVLLALDIPFTFYDSLTASFSARIADRNEYEESCEWKREKNADVLDDIYGGWLFPLWAEADIFGFGKLLKTMKLSVDEIAATLRWVPAGRPWLDRSNEMSGHILALTAGATSTPRICSAYGEDAYEIAQEQKEYLEQAGTPLLYASGGQQAVQAIMAAMNGKNSSPADAGKGQEDNGNSN